MLPAENDKWVRVSHNARPLLCCRILSSRGSADRAIDRGDLVDRLGARPGSQEPPDSVVLGNVSADFFHPFVILVPDDLI